MSDLMLDCLRVLSKTDEDEQIQIVREMERSCSRILVMIGIDLDSSASQVCGHNTVVGKVTKSQKPS